MRVGNNVVLDRELGVLGVEVSNEALEGLSADEAVHECVHRNRSLERGLLSFTR
jgi:hypothetical protein